MILKKISLTNFRNYKKLNLSLYKGINIFYGNNAQGKTNFLESIYVLSQTRSHRSFIDDNLIKSGESYFKVDGYINNNSKLDNKLEIYFDGKNKVLKYDNNLLKKVSDYISIMNIIIFYPDDLEIIKDTPQIRRQFLDLEISQLYNNYYIVLNDYKKLLKMRNDYLKTIALGEKINQNYFDILNNYLVDKAVIIYKFRKRFIDRINENCSDVYKKISGLDNFYIRYINDLEIDEYSDEIIKNSLLKKFHDNVSLELKRAVTLYGPHKDDIEFNLDNKNLKLYGSQGQQRMAVLALKLSEIEIFKKYKETTPILLLDDIFSELDSIKKNNLISYISKNIQTIITTTDLENLDKSILEKSKIFKVDNGKIVKIREVNLNE